MAGEGNIITTSHAKRLGGQSSLTLARIMAPPGIN